MLRQLRRQPLLPNSGEALSSLSGNRFSPKLRRTSPSSTPAFVYPTSVSIPEPPAPSAETGEKDPISHVFDKKTEENEFADMKIDSPKSGSKGFVPQSDGEAIENNNSAAKVMAEKEEEGMYLWKGVGAICSFGMAAATIFIMIFGNAQTNKHNQKLRIQIYSDDKRINQVVQQQATKLNEAMSSVAARGVPLTRAHITSGGYYDGL